MQGRLIAAAGAAALLLGLIATPSFAADDWNAVVAAAKKEGKVTVYNGTAFPVVRKIAGLFTQKYGISAEVLDGRASDIVERIRTEQAAGRHIGDVSFNGLTTSKNQEHDGVFAPHGTLPNDGAIAAPLTDDGTLTPIGIGTYGILVNAQAVKEGEVKGWQDLGDPKWKGKLLADDPRAPGGAEVWFEVTWDHLGGRAFHEKVAANAPSFSRAYAESERRVARGEYPVYFPFNVSDAAKLKGLPIRIVTPVEGIPYVAFVNAVLKDAPHPNAARLFLDFFLTEEAQAAFAQEGFGPAIKGLDDKVPPELAPLTVKAKLMGTTDPAHRDAMIQRAKEIYK